MAANELHVAVVGSGPAGLYTAEALVKHAAALPDPVRVRVDVLDRLPTPYGLVRYGVAPDHKSIKSIAEYLRKVLESPDVRFIGGTGADTGTVTFSGVTSPGMKVMSTSSPGSPSSFSLRAMRMVEPGSSWRPST